MGLPLCTAKIYMQLAFIDQKVRIYNLLFCLSSQSSFTFGNCVAQCQGKRANKFKFLWPQSSSVLLSEKSNLKGSFAESYLLYIKMLCLSYIFKFKSTLRIIFWKQWSHLCIMDFTNDN